MKARWPVIVIISLLVAILVAVIFAPIWFYNAYFNGMMSATTTMVGNTVMLTNQTNHDVKVSYQETNGEDVISVQQTIPESETVYLMLISRNADKAKYEIAIKPSKGSQAKPTPVKWIGEPKGALLEYSNDNTVRWLMDE